MLSKNTVVKSRKALERMYCGSCNVYENQETMNDDKSTSFKFVKVIEEQPCFLSFGSSPSLQSGMYHVAVQTTKVFLAPEIFIKPGSVLEITQNGVTGSYEMSGTPKTYLTHQEIELKSEGIT